MNNSNLKVKVEVSEGESPIISANFEGSVDEVMKGVYDFLSKAIPQFSIVNKVVLQLPSAYELVEKISDKVKVCEGQIIFSDTAKGLSTEERFTLALVASYIGNKIGLLPEPSLSVKSLASILEVSEKTVMNIASLLSKRGLINRPKKGVFEINAKGIALVIAK
ncbi:MAG: hypothetical protein QXU95_03495 [Candidatus Bathyarchaeia archaeon]